MLACIGAIWLIVVAGLQGDPWKIVSFSIYGSTLLLLYSISTLYHSTRGRAKVIMRKLDHLSIYLLIAGSYTPFCLVSLRGPWGWSLFGVVWGLALIGMLRRSSRARGAGAVDHHLCGDGLDRPVAVKPLLQSLGGAGFAWLAAGGAFYTIGILFFAFDSRFRHWHGIWHLFVIAGSLMHFVAVFFYVR